MNERPFLSIVIPAYNASKTLSTLLDSIFSSKRKDFEVIVVDDGSSEDLHKVVTKFSVVNLRLKKNSGPATARNFGVKKAKGKVVLFLDSDVVLFPGTLKRVVDLFKNNPKLVAATGVWDKKQKSNSFFPNFKALRDWSYWINERDEGGFYFLFSPRIAAIKKEVFQELGGFNPKYRGADIEDIELTYRIAEKYPIYFDKRMVVRHEFGGFWSIAKGYFRRSYLWVPLFLKRLKFDPVATTGREAVIGALAAASFPFLVASIFWPWFIWPALFAFGLHFWLSRHFLAFVYQEKGLFFTIKAILVNWLLYLVIYAGALWYFVNFVFKINKKDI